MLSQNPPKRTLGRITDVFTNKIVGQLKQASVVLCGQCWSLWLSAKAFRLYQVNHPYPMEVACDLVGILPNDRLQFAAWTRGFALVVQVDFHRLEGVHKQNLMGFQWSGRTSQFWLADSKNKVLYMQI